MELTCAAMYTGPICPSVLLVDSGTLQETRSLLYFPQAPSNRLAVFLVGVSSMVEMLERLWRAGPRWVAAKTPARLRLSSFRLNLCLFSEDSGLVDLYDFRHFELSPG